MRLPLLLCFFLCTAFAQSSDSIEGGNISAVNVSSPSNSTWHGIIGHVYPSPFSPISINATGSNITQLAVNASSSACTYGVECLSLLFSNSSSAITSLSRGNLSVLDAFIGSPYENATATFAFSETFETSDFGNITGVPTTYTYSPTPGTFRLGYLQDQDGNLVFITEVVSGQPGFNGSLYDFQLMLPTQNGTPVAYYLSVDLLCKEENVTPPEPPEPPGPPQGGGGTHTPYYPGNITPPQPNITNATNITHCDIILYCEEWGPCIDGFREQPCRDLTNCSNTEVFRVERCPMPGNQTIIPIEEIPIIIISPEYPCCLPLIILLLLIPVYALERLRRRKREK